MEFAWSGEVALAYQVVGEGPVDLLFLPGWFSNLDVQWESPYLAGFLRRLGRNGRLIVSDRRGWGLSDRFSPMAVEPLETLTDDLMAVLDAVESDRAVIVSSYDNGMIAQLFAAARPDRVAGLVLIDSFVCPARTEQTPWMPDPAWWEAEIFPTFRRDWGRSWGFDDVPAASEDEREWYYRMQRACCAPGVIVAEERRFLATSTADIVPTIQAPTLVLSCGPGGPADPTEFWLRSAEYLADQIPDARLVSIDKHELFWYAPSGEVLREIGMFVETLRSQQAVFDRVLATVLFTDIVDSTAQAAAMGDRDWHALRDRHNSLVRSQLLRFRGHEVKTIGDGFLATFDGPARAVRCAQAIVRGSDALGIEIRAGLHTGEIEMERDDVAGIAVAIGARVSALARPSEVLVSQTIKDLTTGSGIVFTERGDHLLKGVPDSWRLYAAI